MQISKLSMSLCLYSIFLLVGCSKDKNMEDYRQDQLQQSLARISSVSGTYSGPVISKIDGSNLGNIILKFKASTDIQSNSGSVTNNQNAIVSGSIKLKSLSTTEVSFDNGYYNDVTGDFQVIIPIAQESGVIAKLSLIGQISRDQWIGSIEVKGQPQNGADLNLLRNAPPSNTSAIEVSGTRLEQIRRLNYDFVGFYKVDNSTSPFKLSFTNRDVLPEQSLFKLFSPVRQVSVNCDFTGFELDFTNAILDDNSGILVAHDPIDRLGHPARANLTCKKFEEGADFGWDCEIQTVKTLLRLHLIAKK
ncbi:MAG: hypothetical protein PHY93_08480 [Bacteriovorax sp.]|nr:hypothetical protein [Bacteriovorax sp.]